jgi:hypothetical protein
VSLLVNCLQEADKFSHKEIKCTSNCPSILISSFLYKDKEK